MSNIPHDRPEQLKKIQDIVLPYEEILAVYDAKGVGTGFIGLTTKRVILQDNSFVGGKSAVISIPYSNISTVSFVSDKSVFGQFIASSGIAIQVGNTLHRMEFRGDDKARITHDTILDYILEK